MNTIEKLNLLASHQKELETLHYEKKVLIDVVTASVQDELNDIETKFAGKLDMVNRSIVDLEAEIKQDVLAQGATVKGAFLMAVYNKGRVSWDTSGLIGYAVAHPEMEVFKKVGDPSITLRKIGKGE